MRRLSLVSVLVLVSFLAPAAMAVQIQIEGPQDSLLGAPTINHCTLRKAIVNANMDAAVYPQCQAGSGHDEIVFNIPMTITFALAGINEDGGVTGDLDITDDLTIIGHPDGTIIDGNDLDRIFDVFGAGVEVTLVDLHLRNGSALADGGAIRLQQATLNLSNVTISDSTATAGDAGAIYMFNGATLNMTNSLLTGNFAAHHAGAIYSEGTANITNSTIVSNNSGFSNLTGGIRSLGTTNLRNTIVAGNEEGGDLPNLDGAFNSLGYNIIGDLGTAAGNPTITATTGDQFDVAFASLNLGPLAANGGPTPTRALGAGSIAIDKGHSSGSSVDHRGLCRPNDDPGIANAPGGDGADVGDFETQTGICPGANAAPDAVDDGANVAEDSGASIVDVLANDTDANADALTVIAVTQGANGSVANNGTSVSYTPNANFCGVDSFTYTIDDGHAATDTATVTVTVSCVQDAPVAVDDNANVNEDSGPNAIGVLANDADADGDSLSVSAVTQGANGTVSNNGSSVSYAPNANYFGADSFTYTVSDGNGNFDTATVHVTVTNVNDAPVAVADSYDVDQDTLLNAPAPGVLGNDSDIDGDALNAVLCSGTSNGVVMLNGNGAFSYTPNPGFTGIDSFTYRAFDGVANSPCVTVTIEVHDTEPPVITASLATTTLWSPNNKMVDVGLSLNVTDNSGSATTTVVVYSDEDDGATPDATGMLLLRAERDGAGDGRFYLIRITATDASNNTSTTCLTVLVPKSQSAADVASVTAQAAAAQAACSGAGLFVVGN